MPFTQIIVPAAGLQPFETAASAFDLGLLGGSWKETQRIELDEDRLCMPFEMAYERALNLSGELLSDAGRMPWAAFETQTVGKPCAWLHPCRLDVGMTDMVMRPTDRLQLTDAESRELHALIAPYFEQDGIELKYHSASRWLALGAQFAELQCASLSRVQGRSINDFLPDAGLFPQQLKLSRLQAEVQMLLYTHPISEARMARGLPAVNSFWVDGAGQLDTMPANAAQVKLELRLQDAMHSETAYADAWLSLCAEWMQLNASTTITLCGEKAAITLQPHESSWFTKLLSKIRRSPSNNMREAL